MGRLLHGARRGAAGAAARAARRRARDAAGRRARAGRGLGRDRRRPRPHRRARHHALAAPGLLRVLPRPTAAARASSASWSRRGSACRGCCGRPARSAPSSRRTSWTGWSSCSALPSHFRSDGTGGGVIQHSASDAVLCAIVAAREQAGTRAAAPLVAYCSTQTHSSVEKDLRVAGIAGTCASIAVDDAYAMRPDELARQIAADRAAGLRPFFVLRHARHHLVAGVRPGARRSARSAATPGSGCTSTPRWPARPRICPELPVAQRRRRAGLDSYATNAAQVAVHELRLRPVLGRRPPGR